jgi:hypothetical protein
MDKDLKDAVLAAFDGDADDKTAAADAAEGSAENTGKTSSAIPKAGTALKKASTGAAPSARRSPTPLAPAGRKAAATDDAAGAPAASRPPASSRLSLLLTAVLLVLVAILLAQTLSLKAAVSRQEAVLKDLKKLARISVSVYQEPGKRPQQVIAGHDVDAEGKVRIDKMIIRPLPEE